MDEKLIGISVNLILKNPKYGEFLLCDDLKEGRTIDCVHFVRKNKKEIFSGNSFIEKQSIGKGVFELMFQED